VRKEPPLRAQRATLPLGVRKRPPSRVRYIVRERPPSRVGTSCANGHPPEWVHRARTAAFCSDLARKPARRRSCGDGHTLSTVSEAATDAGEKDLSTIEADLADCFRRCSVRERPLCGNLRSETASAGDRAQRATLGADHAHALTTTPPCANGHPSLSKRPLCSSCITAASVTAMPISAAATALPPARLDLPRARDLRRAGRPAPCPPVELPKAPKAIEVLAPLTRTRSVRASQGQARAGTAVRSTRVQDGVGGARIPAAPRRHPGDSPICESVGGTFSETRRFRLLKLDEGLRLARSSKRLLERPRPQIHPLLRSTIR
jgi:hypothetical protein